MFTINPIILGIVACLENEAVLNKVREHYEIKVKKLKHYEDYLKCEEFKTKKITDANFNQCVKFLMSKLSDETIKKYMENTEVCFVVFYKKEIHTNNRKIKTVDSISNSLSFLNTMVIRHEIKEKCLVLYINPVALYKEKILSKEQEIIEFFKNKGDDVETMAIKYIHNDTILDDLDETFLDIGFTM